jgi:type IV pilus assembly protein PilO
MNLSDPVIQRRAFLLLIGILLGYLYFGSTLMPQCYRVKKAEIARVEAKIQESERKLSLARSRAGTLEVLETNIAEMQEDYRHLEQMLPLSEEIPVFLKQIANLATRAGVKIDLLQPGPVVNGEGISSRGIEMRVHGDYHDVGKFLSNVANAKRVIRTEGLDISGLTGTSAKKNVEGGEKRGTVEASFKATLYMLEGGYSDGS